MSNAGQLEIRPGVQRRYLFKSLPGLRPRACVVKHHKRLLKVARVSNKPSSLEGAEIFALFAVSSKNGIFQFLRSQVRSGTTTLAFHDV